MNNDYTLSEVFGMVYEREFAEFDKMPRHIFSRRHRKAMKAILHPRPERPLRRLSPTKRVAVTVLTIFLALSGVTAGAAAFRGFTLKEHRVHTEIFSVNSENAPKTIEYVYYLPNIPEGYILDKQILDEVWNVSDYFKPNTDEYFKFGQYVKKDFSADFDNEHAQLEPTEVNGKSGLCYELNRWSVLIWDNEDYILKMSGDFTKGRAHFACENY